MAVNRAATPSPAFEMHRRGAAPGGDRRLFLVAGIVFVAIVFAGFARTYYLKGLFGTPALPSLLVHVHGVVMSAWVVLVATQVWLIRSQKVAVHRTLGVAGAWLALLVVVVGFFTALSAGKNGAASFPPNIPRLSFLIVPLVDLVLMVVFVGGAIYYRRRPADHKRLMLLGLINLLPPAIARLPWGSLAALGPLIFFGVPTLFTLFALGFDRRRTGVWNRAFVIGAVVLIASYPVRLVIAGTGTWTRIAEWLTGFALV